MGRKSTLLTRITRPPLLLLWLLSVNLLLAVTPSSGDERYPLEPVDTSSPRATLTSLLSDVDRVWQVYRDQYWHDPSKELDNQIRVIAARALRTMDLSKVAPSARTETGYDAGTFLYETLSRIELPPVEEIPDTDLLPGDRRACRMDDPAHGHHHREDNGGATKG